jgi:hypothetical protein
MRRTLVLILVSVAALAFFAGLVHIVLVAAQLSEPTGPTVQGMTPRRIWATAVMTLALAGVVMGALALRRSARPTTPVT